MSMEHWWDYDWKGKPPVLGEILPQGHIVDHKSQTDFPDPEHVIST